MEPVLGIGVAKMRADGNANQPMATISKVHNGFVVQVIKYKTVENQIGPEFFQMVAKTKEELVSCINEIF